MYVHRVGFEPTQPFTVPDPKSGASQPIAPPTQFKNVYLIYRTFNY